MTDAPPTDAPAPTVSADGRAVLEELAQLRVTIDQAAKVQKDAQERREQLWRAGLALDPRLTKVAMGQASGVSGEYITKLLRPAAPAKAKRARKRT